MRIPGLGELLCRSFYRPGDALAPRTWPSGHLAESGPRRATAVASGAKKALPVSRVEDRCATRNWLHLGLTVCYSDDLGLTMFVSVSLCLLYTKNFG